MQCESITPPGTAEVRYQSSRQATAHQSKGCRLSTSSQTPTLSGGKTKPMSLTRNIAPTRTPVSGSRRGTSKPTTSTAQRTSKRAHAVSSFIAAAKNPVYPPRWLLTSSPPYPKTHGGRDLPVHLQRLTAAALSSTRLQFPGSDAVFG